ncbi:MFS transporter [Streptomyces caatingaensis]|uniref:Arabinose ABC transporter permease n=1 Tax=Streptomyces caatingaensis TaxID=1678637 RepID=A0A0K9X7I8_9ACTN|nr:MFS transporter [Streptomyces caatingaensis]KNB49056.1 arabinose ABC transporter permease [Streptomyces caatingaensis]
MNETAAPRSRPAATLGLVLLGMLTLAMSMSGTTVALPEIGADLGASGAPLQWVITGYFLTASSFMLVAGSLADALGRRRVYRVGAALFTAGLALSATADDVLLLDAARVLAGLGAAGVMAGGGALLGSTFQGAARTRAFGALGTVGGVGLAAGPTLSGALVGTLGWRAAFLVFAAVGAVLLTGTLLVAESRAEARPRLDVAGAVTFIVALGLLMTGVTQGPQNGWSHPLVLGAFGGGAALLVTFGILQRRSAHPVLDLALVRDRRYLAWTLAGLTGAVGFAGTLTYLPTYFQGVDGASSGEAGTTMLLLTAPVLLLPLVGARLVNRGVPARVLIALAMGLVAAGNAWLTVLEPGAGAGLLAGPLLTIGIGTGLANGLVDGQAMGVVAAGREGTAAGFLNTVRGGGQAMMIAALGAGLLSLLQGRLGSGELAGRVASGHLDGADHAYLAGEFTGAWHTVSWTIAGVMAVVAVTVVVLLRAPRGGETPRPRTAPTGSARTRSAAAPR